LKGDGGKEDTKEVGDSGGGWSEVGKQSFEANQGWQIPGNTFATGKKI